jgi:penicillin-binding protein 1C
LTGQLQSGRSRWRKVAWGVLFAAAIGAGALWVAALALPFPLERLEEYPAARVLTDHAGRPLRIRLGPGDTDCRPGYRPDREDWIVRAIVAAEDRRFWTHPGVDVAALLRAVRQNATSFRRVSGASTLTTQVIRLVEPRRRNLWSKAVEAFRAVQLERALDKTEILAQYLNRAPFGSNIEGIEAAASRYFGKTARELSLAEAALLAGIPQSPSRLRPDRHPARAAQRRQYVLDRMLACGEITPREHAEAQGQAVAVRRTAYPFRAPHYCESFAVRERTAWRGLDSVVRTTLDGDLQEALEEALRRHAGSAGSSVRGAAAVILEVRTGNLLALVGSPDYHGPAAGQVNAAGAPRAAGSTLKPFAYALAMDRGRLGPRTVLADVPSLYKDCEPENFDSSFRGLVTARDALILSLNLPAIGVERLAGQARFHQTLLALGLDTLSRPSAHYGLGLVLGNGEVRLLDLANAYACLARGGLYRPVRTLADAPVGPARRVFSPEACWLVSEILGGDERAMDATGHAVDARLPPLAWKTGTSAGFRDAWTVAYNPEVVIGVWMGNPDGSSSGRLVGRTAAAPLVWDIFRRLYPDNDGPWFRRPPGIRSRDVCAESGAEPGPYCPRRVEEDCIEGVTLREVCPVHRPGGEERWPAEIAAFLNARRAPGPAGADAPALRITSPARDSVYRLLSSLPADSQRLVLDAAHGNPVPLHWFVNDRYLGESRPGAPLLWPMERGAFQIVCSDGGGRSDRVRITVE